MVRSFLVKDIALQAGVGTATVDRVLNNRGGVRRQTEDRIRHAMEELERQQQSMVLQGRKFMIDVVAEAPDDFGQSLRQAIESELPLLRPAVFRVRTDIRTHFPVSEIEHALNRIRRRGSHGVILMAPDTKGARDQIEKLADARIPVVTFASDIPRSGRIGYVGLNNRQAGETAAFLLSRWLPAGNPHVLITVRNNRFRGEEDRELGFRVAMREFFRLPRFTELSESPGSERTIGGLLSDAMPSMPEIDAVYSIGGGNGEILDVLAEHNRGTRVFIAHDMYAENRELLAQSKIDVVLDHDFRHDIRDACRTLLTYHRAIADDGPHPPSQIHIVVPPMLAGLTPEAVA